MQNNHPPSYPGPLSRPMPKEGLEASPCRQDGIFNPAPKSPKSLHDKQLTNNNNTDLALCLARIAEKLPDLAEIVKVWPELPEPMGTLIQTHNVYGRSNLHKLPSRDRKTSITLFFRSFTGDRVGVEIGRCVPSGVGILPLTE